MALRRKKFEKELVDDLSHELPIGTKYGIIPICKQMGINRE